MGVMEARRRILLNQPHLIDASGNPISFSTDMAAKMGVKAYFSPVQEGTGDPSPSNVRPISGWTGCEVTRCGKNIAPETGYVDGYFITSTGEVSQNDLYKYMASYVRVKPNTTYSVSMMKTYSEVLGFTVPFYDKNKAFIQREIAISSSEATSTGTYTGTFTTTSDTQWIRFSVPIHSINILISEGNDSTYAPYSGSIYPVTFPAVGKNLITGTGYAGELYNGASSDLKKTSERATYTESANTITITCSVGWYGCLFATGVLPAGSYKVHAETASTTMRATVYVTDENLIYTSIVNNYSASFAPTVTLTAPARIAIFIGNTASGSFNVTNLQVESGTSYTAWEPFTNTLYGGYVDYERGEVVATHKTLTITGNEGITYTKFGSALFNSGQQFSDSKQSSYLYGVCSAQYANAQQIIDTSALVKSSIYRGIQFNNVTTKWGLPEVTSAALVAKLQEMNESGTPLQVCYELATPIHYPITPTLIKSLKGANTIWSDMNGNLEISYWKH